jgi:hypothetical protein
MTAAPEPRWRAEIAADPARMDASRIGGNMACFGSGFVD